MTDRPIPFSAPMVRAILDGRKTQTRRAIIPNIDPNSIEPPYLVADWGQWVWCDGDDQVWKATQYQIGDRLYVREEYYQRGHWESVSDRLTKGGKQKWAFIPADDCIQFLPQGSFRRGRDATDPATVCLHKRLGRFMPRSASRLTLTVTDVRVERLQGISRSDAIAEGLTLASNVLEEFWRWPEPHHENLWLSPPAAYRHLWNVINGPGAWDANPWVVAISFDVKKGNIDG